MVFEWITNYVFKIYLVTNLKTIMKVIKFIKYVMKEIGLRNVKLFLIIVY